MNESAESFIRGQTVIAAASSVPEIQLHLATEITPLWHLTEERLKGGDMPPPYWAFAWPGGQGLARYILDRPEAVKGKRVLDFAAGCGIAAIAAMKAGAQTALACDIDPFAQAAIQLNAALNQAALSIVPAIDFEHPFTGADLILAGDVCYQQAMSARVLRWLYLCKAAGLRVLLADPGRAYIPHEGLKELARYEIPTSRELEDRESRMAVIWELFVPE